MIAFLAALALLSADARPDWWRAPGMGDAKGITYESKPGGGYCLDAVSSTVLAGYLERCKAYPEILDRQLATLFDLNGAQIRAAQSDGALDAAKTRAELGAEADSRWPTYQVALAVVGAGALGVVVGGLLELAHQAVKK